MRRILLLSIAVLLVGCSSPPPETEPVKAAPTAKHPLAKFIELSGFRLTLGKAGQLKIKFTAINHSDADLEELGVHVRIMTTVAKPGDPPVAEFDAKVPALGPYEDHDVDATGTTDLKAYEFPDWQFLRADFDITSPAP
jgi:hypothetical protein